MFRSVASTLLALCFVVKADYYSSHALSMNTTLEADLRDFARLSQLQARTPKVAAMWIELPLYGHVYSTGPLNFVIRMQLETYGANVMVKIQAMEGYSDIFLNYTEYWTQSGNLSMPIQVDTTGWKEGDYVFTVRVEFSTHVRVPFTELLMRVPLYLQPSNSWCVPFVLCGQAKSGATLLKSSVVLLHAVQKSNPTDLALVGKIGGRLQDLPPNQRTINLQLHHEGSCLLSFGAFHIHEPWMIAHWTGASGNDQWTYSTALQHEFTRVTSKDTSDRPPILPMWLGVVRDPRDILVSDHFFLGTSLNGTAHFRTFDPGLFSQMFQNHFEEKVEHVEQMLASCFLRNELSSGTSGTEECLILPYESLVLHPGQAHAQMRVFVVKQFDVSSSGLASVSEEPLPGSSSDVAYSTKRRGRIGEHREYFTTAMLEAAARIIRSRPHTRAYICSLSMKLREDWDTHKFC